MAWTGETPSGKMSFLPVKKEKGKIRIIKPDGVENAEIYVIGEAPGEVEEQLGSSFVGTTGMLLWKWLSRGGIYRSNCRVSNVIWVRPPDNKIWRLNEIGYNQNSFTSELTADILKHKRAVIVAVGETALNYTTNRTRILKQRGSILPFIYDVNIPVIPIVHPSFTIRGNFPYIKITEDDALKIFRIWKNGYKKREESFISHARGATFPVLIQELERIENIKNGFLAYDIEGEFPTLERISLSVENDKAVTIPFNKTFTLDEEVEFYYHINKILSGSLYKVAFNMSFDNEALSRFNFQIRNIFMDIMLAHKMIYQDFPHSLAFLTSTLTDIPYYKDDGDRISDPILNEDYNCRDSSVLIELIPILISLLRRYNMLDFFFNIEMRKYKEAHRLSKVGMPLNQNTVKTLKEDKEEEWERNSLEFQLKSGFRMNVDSNKQVAFLLYDNLKIPPKYRKRKDKETKEESRTITTDEKALREIITEHPEHQNLLSHLLKTRELGIQISTFLDAVQIDGRWRTSISVGGTTHGGRFSMSKFLDKTGISGQNIPKELRACVQPLDDDCVIFEGDSKQAEAMFVAWVSGEDSLINAFQNNIDIHRVTRELLFGIPYEDKNKKLERQVAKYINHATNYWIGPERLVDTILKDIPDYQISKKQAKYYIERLRESRPMTYQWGLRIQENIQSGNRIMFNAFRRMRIFLGSNVKDGDLVRSAISFNPQSSVGDLDTIAMCNIQERIRESDLDLRKNYLMIQVHDSNAGVCEKKNVEFIKSIVKEEMEKEIPNVSYKNVPLIIPCEFKIGKNWFNLFEI